MKKCFEPRRWDIWLADVAFEDFDCSKVRPVLIINGTTCLVLSLKMTSRGPRDDYPGEYQIVHWREAGLIKPTVIRVSKSILLPRDSLKKCIGSLQDSDRVEVIKIYETMSGIRLT